MAKRTPTFQCLTKPILLAGCEYKPAVVMGGATIACLLMAWFAWSIIALCSGLLLLFVGMPFLQQAAKRDPKMMAILLRNVGYQAHYPATMQRKPDNFAKNLASLGVLVVGSLFLIWWLFL
jgi:type IV secretory pathway TrbD component